MRTVSRLFDNRIQAEDAIRNLEAAGFAHGDLSIVVAAQRARPRDAHVRRSGRRESREAAGEAPARARPPAA